MDDLIADLIDLLEAERDEKKARERYYESGNCEWGYHGYNYMEARRRAYERFEQTLNQVIDARVKAVLEQNEQEK